MDKATKRWIDLMNFFSKYWGCHQLPERSFFWKGYQLPVCARCAGVICGELSYVLFFRLTSKIPFSISLASQIPMLIDGGAQLKTKYESNNAKRFVTGFISGASCINLVYRPVKAIFDRRRKKRA